MGFYEFVFENMGFLMRSYHGKMNTMAISSQDLSQDPTKLSTEGQPGSVTFQTSLQCVEVKKQISADVLQKILYLEFGHERERNLNQKMETCLHLRKGYVFGSNLTAGSNRRFLYRRRETYSMLLFCC